MRWARSEPDDGAGRRGRVQRIGGIDDLDLGVRTTSAADAQDAARDEKDLARLLAALGRLQCQRRDPGSACLLSRPDTGNLHLEISDLDVQSPERGGRFLARGDNAA